MNCGRCAAASSVILAASRQLVWSFQSQHWAARFLAHFLFRASGTLCLSTGIGLDPVVSTPMPTTADAEKPLTFFAWARAPFTLFSKTEKVVAWMLAGEVVILGVEKDTLLAGGVVDDAGADLRAIGAAHEQRANRVCAVIDTEGVHEFS